MLNLDTSLHAQGIIAYELNSYLAFTGTYLDEITLKPQEEEKVDLTILFCAFALGASADIYVGGVKATKTDGSLISGSGIQGTVYVSVIDGVTTLTLNNATITRCYTDNSINTGYSIYVTDYEKFNIRLIGDNRIEMPGSYQPTAISALSITTSGLSVPSHVVIYGEDSDNLDQNSLYVDFGSYSNLVWAINAPFKTSASSLTIRDCIIQTYR